MQTLKEFYLIEGVYDRGTFKAIFMAGAPGAGKDTVMHKATGGHGFTEINSDVAFEHIMKKRGLSSLMPPEEEKERNVVRSKAKDTTKKKESLNVGGRKPLIINGTGDDHQKIAKIKSHLESLGYETHMLMVGASNTVSKQRNVARGQAGGRTVPEAIRQEKWDSVAASRPHLQKMFGANYKEYDNSHDERTASPEVIAKKRKELDSLHKHYGKVIAKPPTHPKAVEWIHSELAKKKRT